MKKIFTVIVFVLCAILLFPSYSLHTSAAEKLTSGYYTYIISSGKAKIVSVDNSLSGDVIVPTALDGYTVNEIGASAFSDLYNISSVVLPDTVGIIGEYAFSDCQSLNSIVLGNQTFSIGQSAFSNTKFFLNSNNWKNNVLYIGTALIKAKTNINSTYSVNDGTTVIADQAFLNCKSLVTVKLPDSLIHIGDLAFYYCKALKNVQYSGSGKTLSKMTIGTNNKSLLESLWHYDGYLFLSNCDAGDINGDKSVDNKDFFILFKYVSGSNVETVKYALDVNGDKAINSRDAMCLLKYVSGWDVEIHYTNSGDSSGGDDQGSVIVF